MSLLAFDSYAVASMSAVQTARISNGNHVELDTLAIIGSRIDGTDVVLSTGTGQANGNITLSARRWMIAWQPWVSVNEGDLFIGLWNTGTGASLFPEWAVSGKSNFAWMSDSNIAADEVNDSQGVWICDGGITFNVRFYTYVVRPISVDLLVYLFPLPAAV